MKNTKEGDSLTYSSIPQSSTSSTSSIDGNANNLLDGVPMNMDIDSEASSKLNIGGILGVKTKWDNDEEEDNNHSDNIKKDGSPTSSINGSRGISEIEPTKSSETKDYGSEKMKLGNEEVDDEVEDDIFA
jgi:hypothetical protein